MKCFCVSSKKDFTVALLDRYRHALETAVQLSCRYNVPPLPGRTVIVLSSSMRDDKDFTRKLDFCLPPDPEKKKEVVEEVEEKEEEVVEEVEEKEEVVEEEEEEEEGEEEWEEVEEEEEVEVVEEVEKEDDVEMEDEEVEEEEKEDEEEEPRVKKKTKKNTEDKGFTASVRACLRITQKNNFTPFLQSVASTAPCSLLTRSLRFKRRRFCSR